MDELKVQKYKIACIELMKQTNPEIDFGDEDLFIAGLSNQQPIFKQRILNKLSPKVLEKFLMLWYLL